jgi:LuxR family transcriptional regulator, maltose regulon positive regulatory protein
MKATIAGNKTPLAAPGASFLDDVSGTKFTIPRYPSHALRRDRLLAKLEEGTQARLTLLSAPAGYGKTTLLLDWLQSRATKAEPAVSVAWFTLDARDNDPVRFLRGLAMALRLSASDVGDATLAALAGQTHAPWRMVLTLLINELLAASGGFLLILEDYHVIREQVIHDALMFLLEQLPPRMYIAIATREDPPFPLAQLRTKGALCEVRAADLRFTADEAATFLNRVMRVPVSPAAAAALEARTEGWVAGLQLAGLSMRAAGLEVGGFRGTHRDVVDYLGADVLSRQSSAVQTFLLRTSVLDRLSAPLCETMLGEQPPAGGAQAMLEHIERANLFLIPLDAERRWYRYHHLFAEFLRGKLADEDPGLMRTLHARASAWYEAQGFIGGAIQHALAVREYGRAAGLIERHHRQLVRDGQLQLLLGWRRELPDEVVHSRPRLGVVFAYGLYLTNQPEAAEGYLRAAERRLGPRTPPEDMRFVQGEIALLRAGMSAAAGDLTKSIAHATQARALLPASDVVGAARACLAVARASLFTGDARSAGESAAAAAVKQAEMADFPLLKRSSLTVLARMHVLQGQLRRAAVEFEAIRTLQGGTFTLAQGYCVGHGDMLREWNMLEEAEPLLEQGMALISESDVLFANTVVEECVALARLRHARGDGRGAAEALDVCMGVVRRREFTPLFPATVAAARAHLWLMQGNFAAASRWADTSGLGLDDEVGYSREREHLVFARVLLARKDPALGLLRRMLKEADARGRLNSTIEILAVYALTLAVSGRPVEAMTALDHALTLGEPEGYVRVFVDEGAPMASLLRRARVAGIAPDYIMRLLEIFHDGQEGWRARRPPPTGINNVPQGGEATDPLVEPLTVREGEILRLVAGGASNRDIANELYLSPSTVKGHVHHIIGKLGVKARAQAIAKARSLGLL